MLYFKFFLELFFVLQLDIVCRHLPFNAGRGIARSLFPPSMPSGLFSCFHALAVGSEWMGCQLHQDGIPPALSPPGESGRQPQPVSRRPVWLFQIRTQMVVVQTESLKSPGD